MFFAVMRMLKGVHGLKLLILKDNKISVCESLSNDFSIKWVISSKIQNNLSKKSKDATSNF